jgi:hypothetical protein
VDASDGYALYIFIVLGCALGLVGDLSGTFLRQINIQHRLVYEVLHDQRTIKVLRMWSNVGWLSSAAFFASSKRHVR